MNDDIKNAFTDDILSLKDGSVGIVLSADFTDDNNVIGFNMLFDDGQERYVKREEIDGLLKDHFTENLDRTNEDFIMGSNIFISDLKYEINYNTGKTYSRSNSYISIKDENSFTFGSLKEIILERLRKDGLNRNFDFSKDDIDYDETTGTIKAENIPLYDRNYRDDVAVGTITFTCKLWVHPNKIDLV